MDDPNVTYKLAFLALADELGRMPTSRDKEWLELGNAYSRSYRPADEPVIQPVKPTTPAPAVSEPKPAVVAPRVSQGRMRTTRGPRGGILAECVVCGQEWEREPRRGRPSVKCEECR